MATKDLDRWLLRASEIGTIMIRPREESVRPVNTSPMTTKSVPVIICNHCGAKAERVGAQDSCDVYKCGNEHLTRLLVGIGKRVEWREKTDDCK